jgi:hypothetical protein
VRDSTTRCPHCCNIDRASSEDPPGLLRGDNPPDTALARQNVGLFAQPEIREAIRGATGLFDDALDRVSEGLAKLGVALVLPNGADMNAKYANAIALVRDHGYSVQKAARTLGISAIRLCWSIGIGGNAMTP